MPLPNHCNNWVVIVEPLQLKPCHARHYIIEIVYPLQIPSSQWLTLVINDIRLQLNNLNASH